MRIRITGGYGGEVSAELRDRRGSDLTAATLKMALLDEALDLGDAAFPAASDAAWRTPGVSVQGGIDDGVSRATMTLGVHAGGAQGYAAGSYSVWLLFATQGGLAIPVRCSNDVVVLY